VVLLFLLHFLQVFSLFLPRFFPPERLFSLSTAKRRRKNGEKEVICSFLLGEKGEENSLLQENFGEFSLI